MNITNIKPLTHNKWRADFTITSHFDDWGLLALRLMNEIKKLNSNIIIDTAGVNFEGNSIYNGYVEFYADEAIGVPLEDE